MIIRLYQPEDFPSVFDLMVRTHHLDSISEPILREKIEGDPGYNPEMTYAAVIDEKVAGFLQGVARDIRGEQIAYIKLMGVLPEFRRRGIARSMYHKMEAAAIQGGATTIRIYDVALNYLIPGIDPRYTPAVCFAERMGFRRFTDTSNLLAPLNSNWNTSEYEEKLKPRGITICRADDKYRESLMKFLDTHFSLWRHEVTKAFENDPVSIHIALENGTVQAFAAHSANNTGTGWFGPMGTDPGLRGRGVGSILLKRCMNDLKKAGYKNAIIPWVGPIAFYSRHCDAVVDRVFWRYEKRSAGI